MRAATAPVAARLGKQGGGTALAELPRQPPCGGELPGALHLTDSTTPTQLHNKGPGNRPQLVRVVGPHRACQHALGRVLCRLVALQSARMGQHGGGSEQRRRPQTATTTTPAHRKPTNLPRCAPRHLAVRHRLALWAVQVRRRPRLGVWCSLGRHGSLLRVNFIKVARDSTRKPDLDLRISPISPRLKPPTPTL